jgi:hypothetical protein
MPGRAEIHAPHHVAELNHEGAMNIKTSIDFFPDRVHSGAAGGFENLGANHDNRAKAGTAQGHPAGIEA